MEEENRVWTSEEVRAMMGIDSCFEMIRGGIKLHWMPNSEDMRLHKIWEKLKSPNILDLMRGKSANGCGCCREPLRGSEEEERPKEALS